MQLHYRQHGQGQPLIILHGLFGQSDNWNTIAKKLAEHKLTVYTLDLRNHGQSPHSPEMNYELMAKDVKEFIDTHHIPTPIMMGHSMGGKVAMWFDYLFPNELKKMIVVDIGPKKYSSTHSEVFAALNAVDFSRIHHRKDVELILRKYLKEESIIQFLLKNVYWEKENQLNWRFNLKAIQNHYEDILAPVPDYVSQTTTLFIRGANSNYIKNDDIPFIQSMYPQVQISTIAHAGHWVHAEQPSLFIENVLNFASS